MAEQERRARSWKGRARRAIAGVVVAGVVAGGVAAGPITAGAAPADGQSWLTTVARTYERTRVSLVEVQDKTTAGLRAGLLETNKRLEDYIDRIPPLEDWLPVPEPEPEPPSDACGALVPKAGGGTWSCTLAENFASGALDPAVWLAQRTRTSSYTLGGECVVDSPNNISFVDDPATATPSDHLRLTARKEAEPFFCEASRPEKSFTTQHTGATVLTGGRFTQAYGRFEVRAKLPDVTVPGAQFSFWMWRQDGNPVGEIDPMEWYSKFSDRGIPMLHGAESPWTNNFCVFDPAKGPWHTYTLEWSPQAIRIFYDGTLCLENTAWGASQPAPFDTPMMLALTIGLDPAHLEDPATPLPTSWSTDVDYVKVWQ
jgi:hypothetical protein